MHQMAEVKLVGWLQIAVLAAIMIIGYFANRAEIRIASAITQRNAEQTRKEIDAVKQQVQVMQDQQKRFCLDFETEMDRWFRNRPELKNHPDICTPYR